MTDQDAVRRIALELPEVREDDDRFAFSVGEKAIAASRGPGPPARH